MAKKSEPTVRIRQVRSPIGRPPKQRQVLRGLGLRRIRHEVERPDTPAVRGMIDKVSHLVEIVASGPVPDARSKPVPDAVASGPVPDVEAEDKA